MGMYRLLRTISVKKQNLHISSYRCSLCKRASISSSGWNVTFGFTVPARNFSKEELKKLQKNIRKKKKLKEKRKKYAELVQVENGGKSQLTEAIIQNLKAKYVSQLSQQPMLTLEQFHSLFGKNKPKLFETGPITDVSPNAKKSSSSPTSAVCHQFADNNDYLLSKIKLSLVNDEVLLQKSEKENDSDLIERDTENIEMYLNSGLLFREHDLEPHFIGLNSAASAQTPDKSNIVSTKKGKRKSKCNKNQEALFVSGEMVVKSSPKSQSVKCPLFNSSSEEPMQQQTHMSCQVETGYKCERFNTQLTSYIELCVQCDLLNMAMSCLSRYIRIQNLNPKAYKITSADPFDILLQGYATKANFEKIQLIMNMMSNNNVPYTLQTFSACFEYCARLPQTDKSRNQLKMFRTHFESRGFRFNDLMTQCSFVRNQRDYVMKSLKLLDPTFIPQYEPPHKSYLLPCLEKLNSTDRVFQSPAATLITEEEMNAFVDEQVDIELKFVKKVKSVAAPTQISPEVKLLRKKWDELFHYWRSSVKNAFIKRVNLLESQLKHTKQCFSMNMYPYLKILPADQYVDVVMNEIIRIVLGSETYSPVLNSLRKRLGKQVELRYDMRLKEQSGSISKMKKIYKEYCKWYLNPQTDENSHNTRHKWQAVSHEMISFGPTIEESSKHWPHNVLLEVGKFLYDIILNDLKIDINVLNSTANNPRFHPAFHRIFRYQGQCLIEEVKPTPIVFNLYKKSQQDYLHFDINVLPMLAPPVPWTSAYSGGYTCTKVNFVRLEHAPRNPVLTTPAKDMVPVFDSLNQLSSIPWKINEPILDVMLKVFRDGGSKNLKIPLSAEAFFKAEQAINPNQKYTSRERFLMYRRKSETYSLWCDGLYRLSLANHYRKRVFWFPHNLDFRGRVYPVPPHLTHLGSDLARCLLVFAKGKKLGSKGLDWLKIHCINLTGLKKRHSSYERLRYANEILPQILDSAERPLTGKMWWTESDEIWQTLACCMEIKAALDSGTPENYVSHFPVHQDGSCNGLQHYAALGRDEIGGKSVNLTPCDAPQDVYSCVVALVEERREQDAKNGSSIAQALEGYVKRKVIKQTVMTTVYGVTKYGGRLQIAKQLKDEEGFPEKLVWNGSLYLVHTTFVCLRNMFASAKQIQDWLTDCAKFISTNMNEFVEWNTPLGLPVLQPYCKGKLQKTDHKLKNNEAILPIKTLVPVKTKQKNAFPPNYVHSLDSSHMMLTSLFCENEGITFVSVHDCFWTHPSTVDIMGKVCREQFVMLHSLPILEDLSKFFVDKYCTKPNQGSNSLKHGQIFFRIPKKGNLHLPDILNSEYFFS